MTARKPVKRRPRLVGVITSISELAAAFKMTNPPDLFELRLDYLADSTDRVKASLHRLKRPIIVTCRHPREGGLNNLPLAKRRILLQQFLSHARYVDIELRSVHALRDVVNAARRRKIRRIVSFHDFASLPSARSLHTKLTAAKRLGADIFKLAVRTDTPAQLARLTAFVEKNNVDPFHSSSGRRLALSVMGIGRMGVASRLALAKYSTLVYVALGKPKVEGQLSLSQLRKIISR